MTVGNRFPENPIGDRMQELLARAAQNRVDEEHTQGAALEQIQQRLEGLESALQTVREWEANDSARLDALSGQLEGIANQAPPAWAEGLAERMDSLREQVRPVADLSADVRGLAGRVDEALYKISAVAEAEDHNARRFDDLCQRLDRLQSSVDAAAASTGKLDEALDALGERAERLERGIEALGERTEQALAGLGSRIEGATGRLDGLDGRLDGVQGRLEGIDNRLGGVTERLEHMPATLETAEIHRRLAEVAERRPPDHREQLASLDERLREAESHLVETVDSLGSDVRARPERQELEDTVAKVVESAGEQTVERMSALEESVVALAEALLDRGSREAMAATRRRSNSPSNSGPPPGDSEPASTSNSRSRSSVQSAKQPDNQKGSSKSANSKSSGRQSTGKGGESTESTS